MYGNPRRTDADELVRLVYFNNAYVSRYLAAFSEVICRRFHPHTLQVRKAGLKGDLKDVIVSNVPYRNSRVDELLRQYSSNPELYFRETPFHGTLYFSNRSASPCYVGSSRIKRVRRLAEKSAQRIIDGMYATIKTRAVNLIVRLRPNRQIMASKPLGEHLINVMQMHRITPDDANLAFREFVMSGEDTVNLEIILSDYQEMLESEIGRCMHEDRIIRQRVEQQYTGQLAQNIEYLIGYLFLLPASNRMELEEIPFKLWHRYLPDYFDDVIKKLFNIPSVEVLE
jgi:hypothetical protein